MSSRSPRSGDRATRLHARSQKNARPASGDDRCSSTRAAAPAVDIGAVAKERTRARRGRWAALRPRCADSFQPESTTGLRGDFCSDTERHTRRPHLLAGSARPPPPTLTKVTVPSSEEGSGLHGPFLPYSGRTSTGSWTAPGGAARPEDRASSARPSAAPPRRPADSPGHRNTGGGSVLPLFRPDPAVVLNARRIRSYA